MYIDVTSLYPLKRSPIIFVILNGLPTVPQMYFNHPTALIVLPKKMELVRQNLGISCLTLWDPHGRVFHHRFAKTWVTARASRKRTRSVSSKLNSVPVKRNSNKEDIELLKSQLIATVAPLERGLKGTRDIARLVEEYVNTLGNRSHVVRLDDADVESSLLNGRWTLLYSSEFVPGNAKNPGNVVRPSGPLKIVNVHQSIDSLSKRLSNVVEIELQLSLANIISTINRPTVTANLGHSYSIQGASTIRITYEDTHVTGEGGFNDWLDSMPEVNFESYPFFLSYLLDESFRSSSFDVVFLDDDMRVTLGDRQEIRVFLKDRSSA